MKILSNIWLLGSTIIGLYYAWQWNTTQNPQYEPKLAIIGGISALVAFWFRSNVEKSANGAFFPPRLVFSPSATPARYPTRSTIPH